MKAAAMHPSKKYKPRDRDVLWVCADGRKMSVADMHDDHLNNAIRKIERMLTWRREWLSRLYAERYIRLARKRLH